MIGYRMPTRVHIQPGALDRLSEAVRGLGIRAPLIIADPGLRSHTGWVDRVQTSLGDAAIRTDVFDGIEANPRTTTATRAAEAIRDGEFDGVIGLGGGSALDAAKAAAMLATNELRIEQYEGKNRYANEPLPFVAIPTTCGTGSEVTWVSVLSHEPTQSKISVKGESMFANQALVDADLLASLPAELVAWTGVDALTHALECITCLAANPISDSLAEKSVALLFHYLPRAYADIAGDHEAREAVMRASTLAGLAFGNADVAGVHCLSESLGGLYDVPHGLANAILLLPVMRYHQAHIEKQLARLDSVVFGASIDSSTGERSEHFLFQVSDLLKCLAVPKFSTLGVPTEDYPRVAEWATRNGSNRSNPQPMAPGSYRRILSQLT